MSRAGIDSVLTLNPPDAGPSEPTGRPQKADRQTPAGRGAKSIRPHFQRTGALYEDGNWWRLRFYQSIEQDDGTLTRVRLSTVLGLARGRDAISAVEARRRAQEKLDEVNRSEPAPGSLMRVSRFIRTHFLPEYVATLRPGGQVHYRSVLDHVLAGIGDLVLRDVGPEHIQQLCSGILKKTWIRGKGENAREIPYSVQTAVHLRNAASALFEHARALRFYPFENPARHVRLPEMVRKQLHALTMEQVKTVISRLPTPAAELVHFAVVTSMNVAELVGLRWKRVNLTDGFLTVDGEALPPFCVAIREQFRLGQHGPTKTKHRRRNVPLSQETLAMLLGLAARGEFVCPDDPVFASRAGTPIDAHNLSNRLLRPLGRELGMPWLGWHVLRRTHATLLDQLDMSPADRVCMMGHRDLRMTLHYTAEDMERRRPLVDQLAKSIAVANDSN